VASALRAGVRGAEAVLDAEALESYVAACEAVLASASGDYDVVVAHDPELLGAVAATNEASHWIWRCHVDASRPDEPTWQLAEPLVARFGHEVYAADSMAPPEREGPGRANIAPAIDPLAPRNDDLPLKLSGSVLRSLGIDLTRPFVCHAGLDRYEDPHAAIDAFAIAREERDDLQLVLAGVLPGDGTDDWRIVGELSDYAGELPDVHVLTNHSGVGNVELNALRKVARVAIQRSLGGDFGLAISEALWKGTPAVAGREGGGALQIGDDAYGYLTGTASETADRVLQLVADPGLAIELGQAGREHVRERFLVTRLLEDELGLMATVLEGSGDPATLSS
jgi:trehalose synthase